MDRGDYIFGAIFTGCVLATTAIPACVNMGSDIADHVMGPATHMSAEEAGIRESISPCYDLSASLLECVTGINNVNRTYGPRTFE